jgi:thiol-disulfide isomerase/thioredoxin
MYATLEGYYDKIEQITSTGQPTTAFRRTTPHSIQANVSSWNVAPSTYEKQEKKEKQAERVSIPIDVIDPVQKEEKQPIPIDAIDPVQKEEKQEKETIPIDAIDPEIKSEQMSIPVDMIDPIQPIQAQPVQPVQPVQQVQQEQIVHTQLPEMAMLSHHMERPNARTEKAKAELERQQAEQQMAQFQATQMARLQEQQKERFAHMLPPPQANVVTEQYSPSIRELQDDTMSSVLNTPTVTLFYAPWCSHCVHMKPIYNEAYEQCKQNGTQVEFTAINGSAWKESTKKYNITGFPTLMMFSQGKKHVYAGRRISSDICKWISEHL